MTNLFSAGFFQGLAVLVAVVAGLFWVVRWTIRRSRDPRSVRFKWSVTLVLLGGILVPVALTGPSYAAAFIVPFVCVGMGVVMSLMWTPHLAAWFCSSITSAIDGGSQELTPQPLYSAAESKRKAGRYREALVEIQGQLERFPEDHHGQMLLASIYAENLNDLSRAEVVIQRLCARPQVTPNQLAGALNTLSDWHLRYGQDPERARQDLQTILERLPDTEFAQNAEQRLAHLARPDRLMEGHDRPTLVLKPGVQRIGLRKEPLDLKPREQAPAEKATSLLQHLAEFPNDNEAREELARVYADDFGRPEMAIQELEQLITHPHQQQRRIVRWLNLITDLKIRHQRDVPAAVETLQRIIDLYPKAAVADQARSRMALLARELQGQQETAALTLGEYEQRLGLKKPQRREEDRG